MSAPEYVGGGFDNSLRAGMSEQMQRRLALEDQREAKEAAKEAKRQEQIAAEYQERAINAALREAYARGETPSPAEAYRTNGASLGRTVGEFIESYNLKMDIEDQQHEAEERQAFNRWKLDRSAESSAESSAPTPAEKLEAGARAARAERIAERARSARDRQRETREMIRADHSLRRQGFGGV